MRPLLRRNSIGGTIAIASQSVAVASTAKNEQASGTTITPTLPTGTATGELLILITAHASNSSIATPSGWTLISSSQPYQGGAWVGFWYKVAAASQTMPTLTVNNGLTTAVTYRISGARTSSSPVTSAIFSVGSGDQTSAYMQVSATTDAALVLYGMASNAAGVSLTGPSGVTAGPSSTGTGYVLNTVYEIQATAGTGAARTWNSSGSTRFFGVGFAIAHA